MPTFLRFSIGLIGFVYLQAATAAGIALVVLHGAGARSAALPPLTLAIPLLALVPMTAGGVTSYTTWHAPESRARLRRGMVVLAVLQLTGAVLLIVAGALGLPWWFVATAVVIGVALTPALLALGRAARHRDRGEPAGDDWVDTTRDELQHGWRRGAIGFVIGLALDVVLVAFVSTLARQRPADLAGLLVESLGIAFLGGAIGMAITTLSVARRLREITGPEYDVRRRIVRAVVRGKPEHLDGAEQRSAVRYARVVGALLLAQTTQSLLMVAALILINAHLWLDHPDALGWLSAAFLLFALVAILVAVPQTVTRIRRARAYAEQHAAAAA